MGQSKQLHFGAVLLFGLVACVLYGVGAGLRGDVGILLQPLALQCGLTYADVSFCIAVMQLMFGATQPLFGIVATRTSNRFVLVLGTALLAASLVGMALARSFAGLLFALGVLFGAGAGALAFGLILTSAIHFVGPQRAMLISGMLNASAGLGSFIFSPVLQGLLDAGGLEHALYTMLVPVAVLVPAAFVVTSRDKTSQADEVNEDAPVASVSVRQMFRKAFSNRTYVLLVAGFSTCGFHMVIIESHLFNQFTAAGINATSAAWAFSVYGVATIIGALLSGFLSTRMHKGKLLAFYYGFRAVWAVVFLFLMPKTLPFAVLYSIGLGFTGDATVSPTSGLVNREFRIEQVATLIGFLYFVHQIGAFLSAWLGGVLLDATGGYTAIWLLDVAVCTFAAIMSARIKNS